MKAKQGKVRAPKKHSGDHSSILGFLIACIEMGDEDYKAAAYRIYNEEWMSPNSKTGSDFELLKTDCKRTWDKAMKEVEFGSKKEKKKYKNFEKLKFAEEWVNCRVSYDTFLGQYLADGIPTNPAAEYSGYNSQADENSFIEKPNFINAFEMDRMPRVSTLTAWAKELPKAKGTKNIDKLASYIPAKDPEQARLFLTGWLIRAYQQSINPMELDANSIVNRWFLILHQQRQDSGKSGFFRWLAPDPAWVKENGLEDNKDGYIALSRYLFILDDELGGLSRVAQHERLKAMISTSKIDVRPPYGKVDVTLQRTASFCGSTNNTDIFPSSEGTTRFLVLPLSEEEFNWREYTKKVDRLQLWAEVKNLAQSTKWLDMNTPAIVNYRNQTNADFIKEDIESFVVGRYLKPGNGPILRTGDIMRTLCEDDYGYNNLNINRLGQAMRKAFGERIHGRVDGKNIHGYQVDILPAYVSTASTGTPPVRANNRVGGFKAKTKRRSQR